MTSIGVYEDVHYSAIYDFIQKNKNSHIRFTTKTTSSDGVRSKTLNRSTFNELIQKNKKDLFLAYNWDSGNFSAISDENSAGHAPFSFSHF